MGYHIWYVDSYYGAHMVETIISGDLVFVRLLGHEVVVINSQRVADALLEKRSRIYSDRPYIATLEPYVLMLFFHLIIL
jgi:hypothetical protein